jgi:DNA polymerase (family 10)
MSNPVELLEEIRRLMQLKGENPFKVRAYENAIQLLTGRDDVEKRVAAGTLTELEGIGKGIATVLTEFVVQGRSSLRDELRSSIPPGLIELTQLPGLGPKKAMVLIDELGIHSLGELEYACQENRLVHLKGFGEKTQKKILDSLQFHRSNSGRRRLDQALPISGEILKALRKATGGEVSETGAIRRRMETVGELEYVVEIPSGKKGEEVRAKSEKALEKFRDSGTIRASYVERSRFGFELARTTATHEHWAALGEPKPFDVDNEEAFYKKLKIEWIPPEARETGEEVALAKAGKITGLLADDGLQGVFHNHTTRSDGTGTLEQMVVGAKKLGLKYIGISDHSQSAFYAQGLKKDDLQEQEKEIRALQDKHPEIRIFWGIESDILADGALDYDPALLKRFDFVIASIHSRFQMDREAMTERLLAAIRNPYTRFVGHITGRLLLGRKGYDVHMEKLIAATAEHDVAIEINSHPHRLDIDWRWGPELRKRGALVSVNPDAHEVEGLSDSAYGVMMARKALIPATHVVNSWNLKDVQRWLKRG